MFGEAASKKRKRQRVGINRNFFSFPILAQLFGDAHPTETPSPLHPATTSNAVPMLTRLPPKRSFASPIRSQSASLSLGTRVEEEEEKFEARSSNFHHRAAAVATADLSHCTKPPFV